MKTFRMTEIGELPEVVSEVLAIVGEGASQNHAVVLALSGDLGAGKTTFTQELSKQLGVTEAVTSPTFVVMRHYETDRAKTNFSDLYHLDVYRLEEENELGPLGFAELLKQPKALLVIEWAEKFKEHMPADTWWLNFNLVEGETREVTLSQHNA